MGPYIRAFKNVPKISKRKDLSRHGQVLDDSLTLEERDVQNRRGCGVLLFYFAFEFPNRGGFGAFFLLCAFEFRVFGVLGPSLTVS